MSFLKRVLSRESQKIVSKSNLSDKDLLDKPDLTINTALQTSKTVNRTSTQKSATINLTTTNRLHKKPPLPKRKLSSNPTLQEPAHVRISLKSISISSSNSQSPTNKIIISPKILKPNDFIEPEVDSSIPSLKEYLANTPNASLNRSLGDLSMIATIQKLKSREGSRSFSDGYALSSVDNISENTTTNDSFNESPPKSKPKELMEKQTRNELSVSRKLKLVPRDKSKRPPKSVLIYEGDELKFYDIKTND